MITHWFLTWDEFYDWECTLPLRERAEAKILAHVGHTPMDPQPRDCTACALDEAIINTIKGEAGVVQCRHGVRLDVEACDVGCLGSSDA